MSSTPPVEVSAQIVIREAQAAAVILVHIAIGRKRRGGDQTGEGPQVIRTGSGIDVAHRSQRLAAEIGVIKTGHVTGGYEIGIQAQHPPGIAQQTMDKELEIHQPRKASGILRQGTVSLTLQITGHKLHGDQGMAVGEGGELSFIQRRQRIAQLIKDADPVAALRAGMSNDGMQRGGGKGAVTVIEAQGDGDGRRNG